MRCCCPARSCCCRRRTLTPSPLSLITLPRDGRPVGVRDDDPLERVEADRVVADEHVLRPLPGSVCWTSMPSFVFPWPSPLRSTPMKFRTTMRPLEFASARPLSPFPTTLSAMITPSALLTPTDQANEPLSVVVPSLPTPTLLKRISELSGTPAIALDVDAGLAAVDDVALSRESRRRSRCAARRRSSRPRSWFGSERVAGRVRADRGSRRSTLSCAPTEPSTRTPSSPLPEMTLPLPTPPIVLPLPVTMMPDVVPVIFGTVRCRAEEVLRDRVAVGLDEDPGVRRAFELPEVLDDETANRRAARPRPEHEAVAADVLAVDR